MIGSALEGFADIQDIFNFTGEASYASSTMFKVLMISSGGLSSGISASLAGGNFWKGARQGVITSGLNHAAHAGAESLLKKRSQISIEICPDCPSTYGYKNGETYKSSDGNTYQVHNNKWVKLSGVKIDYAAFGRTNGGVYIPNMDNYGDSGIYEAEAIQIGKDAINLEGFVASNFKDLLKGTFSLKTMVKTTPLGMITNIYWNGFKRIVNNAEHNSNVESLRNGN